MPSRAGSPNKRKNALKALLQKEYPGYNPVLSMARIAHQAEKDGEKQLAAQMHREVAQYVEPKKRAIEVTGEDGGPIEVRSKQLVVMGVKSETQPDDEDSIPGG